MKVTNRQERRQRIKFRIRKRVRGTAERPRLSVFRSVSHIYVQVIDDLNGQTLASASSLEAAVKAKMTDGARAGKTIEEVTKEARTALTKNDVMDGVADLIPMVQIEAVFTDGSRLVTVHTPIQ